MQLDMFAEPPRPAPPPDPVAEKIVGVGYAPNEYILGLNRAINVIYGELPSRLFQFPVEFVSRDRQPDGQSKLWLRHPDFEGLPFLDIIERDVGVRPVWSPVDEYGRDRTEGMFWHAIDLLDDAHFRDMLATRNFTDKRWVINGLRFHLDCGSLSVKNARAVLAEYGCTEPDDRSEAFLNSPEVRVCNCQQGKIVGMWTRDERSVWAAIHGLESKRFKRDRAGYLRFSPGFLAEKEAA
jgi:hypothetical protein